MNPPHVQNDLVDATISYLELRKENRVTDLVNMCSDNIVIDSERDGIFRGKEEVTGYYTDNKAVKGDWDQPYQTDTRTVVVTGRVYFLFLTFHIKATFDYNVIGKIVKITIRRL